MRAIVRSGPAARTAAVLILLGPLVSWVAEFVTAAAWQDPHLADERARRNVVGMSAASMQALEHLASPHRR